MASNAKSSNAKPVSLALQGGGAHGAFTWGVLDAILEDGRLEPKAITATSAGAMNAAAYAEGLKQGGPDGAREALERFWRAVSRSGAAFRPGFSAGPLGQAWRRAVPFLDALTRVTSPYDVNPFNIDPLRDVLEAQIDLEAVHACGDVKLFIAATCVATGKARIFKGEDVTLEALLASAALPFIRHAVEIEGRAYWDGGFTGNPALWPLFYADAPADLVIVHINPLVREGTPKSSEDIMDRVNEVTFNAALLAELRAVAFVKKLIGKDLLKDPQKARLRDILVHSIRADDALRPYPASTKYDTSWRFLVALRDAGREAAKDWLDAHADAVGKRSTVDLETDYLQAG